MRLITALTSTVLCLGVAVSVVPPASARTGVSNRPACATPTGDVLVAHDAVAVVVRNKGAYPTAPVAYSYCDRSVAEFRHLANVQGDSFVLAISPLRLAGDYLAFVEEGDPGDSDEPSIDTTKVVDVVSGKTWTVSDEPNSVPDLQLPGGVGQSMILSASGVVLGTEVSYASSPSGPTPTQQYVIAFQAATGTSTLLAAGAAGAFGDLEIFDCAAGCLPTTTAVVGWTSSGSAQYADLSAAS